MESRAPPTSASAGAERDLRDPDVKEALPFAPELKQAVEQAQPRPVSPVYSQISQAIYKNVNQALSRAGGAPGCAVGRAVRDPEGTRDVLMLEVFCRTRRGRESPSRPGMRHGSGSLSRSGSAHSARSRPPCLSLRRAGGRWFARGGRGRIERRYAPRRRRRVDGRRYADGAHRSDGDDRHIRCSRRASASSSDWMSCRRTRVRLPSGSTSSPGPCTSATTPTTTASRTTSVAESGPSRRPAGEPCGAGLRPGPGRYAALTRTSAPVRDTVVGEADRLRRHFVQDTDIGSLGVAPGATEVTLRASYPFAEERTSASTPTGGLGGVRCRTARSLDQDRLRAEPRRRRPHGRDLGHHDASDERARQAPQPGFTLAEALEHRQLLTQLYFRGWDARREPEASPPATSCTSHRAPARRSAR